MSQFTDFENIKNKKKSNNTSPCSCNIDYNYPLLIYVNGVHGWKRVDAINNFTDAINIASAYCWYNGEDNVRITDSRGIEL